MAEENIQSVKSTLREIRRKTCKKYSADDCFVCTRIAPKIGKATQVLHQTRKADNLLLLA